MMLVPRNFNLLDDFFDDDFFTKKKSNLMKSDIRETDDKFILDMDLPGFDKENINLSLNNGYLQVSAKVEKEDNDEQEGKYVHRERFCGECSRSFYVGEDTMYEDIDAEFKNGILTIEIKKKDEETSNEPKQIEIK